MRLSYSKHCSYNMPLCMYICLCVLISRFFWLPIGIWMIANIVPLLVIHEWGVRYRKKATNRAHLTLMFYFLRWVPQFSNFGIWIKLMAHLILVLKSKMEILIEKSWSFNICLHNCIGHWKLPTLTTNHAQSMFNQLLLSRGAVAKNVGTTCDKI